MIIRIVFWLDSFLQLLKPSSHLCIMCLCLHFCQHDNALREFLSIWHKYSLGVNDLTWTNIVLVIIGQRSTSLSPYVCPILSSAVSQKYLEAISSKLFHASAQFLILFSMHVLNFLGLFFLFVCILIRFFLCSKFFAVTKSCWAPSIPFLWTQYPRNGLMEISSNFHLDSIVKYYILVVKGHCHNTYVNSCEPSISKNAFREFLKIALLHFILSFKQLSFFIHLLLFCCCKIVLLYSRLVSVLRQFLRSPHSQYNVGMWSLLWHVMPLTRSCTAAPR